MKKTAITFFAKAYTYFSFICAFFVLVVLAVQPVYAASTATLYLAPGSGTRTVGSVFSVALKVNTGGTPANAFEATVNFPTNLLTVTQTTSGGSICSLWVSQPSFDNGSGTARFSCGLPNPGYNGDAGMIGQITFRAKAVGEATVSISNAKVLANDGSGTNILNATGTARFTIAEPAANAVTISSGTHPDEQRWYQERNVSFNWTRPGNIEGFNYEFNQIQDTTLGETIKTKETSASINDTADGTWYFHVRAKSSGGWSSTSHFKVNIDGTAPTDLTVVLDPDGESDRRPMISFSAKDATSGIERYDLKLDNGEWSNVDSPYIPETITAGQHTFFVRALDRAGNEVTGARSINILSPGTVVFTSPQPNSLFNVGDEIIFSGTAKAKSQITLYIDGQPVKQLIEVDESGHFTLVYKELLRPGSHSVTADIQYDGIEGEKSKELKLTIDGTLIEWFGYKFPAKTLLFGLGLLVLILFIIIVWMLILAWKRRKRCEEPPLVETAAALSLLKKELDEQLDDQLVEEQTRETRHRIKQLKQDVNAEITSIEKRFNKKKKE